MRNCGAYMILPKGRVINKCLFLKHSHHDGTLPAM